MTERPFESLTDAELITHHNSAALLEIDTPEKDAWQRPIWAALRTDLEAEIELRLRKPFVLVLMHREYPSIAADFDTHAEAVAFLAEEGEEEDGDLVIMTRLEAEEEGYEDK